MPMIAAALLMAATLPAQTLEPKEPAEVAAGVMPDSLGDTDNSLVYFPLAPCRLLDTRNATVAAYQGPKGPGTEVAFSVNDSLTAQGGNASGCGVPAADPEALSVVVTAVPTNTGQGNLRAYRTGGAIPTASMVNYQGGVVAANGVIAQSGTGISDELTVRNQGAGTTHIVVDVTGYFARPSGYDVLGSGQTLKGVYGIDFVAPGASDSGFSAITFPQRLSSAPIAVSVNFIPMGGSSTADCPGSYTKPTAAPGHLCVYESGMYNIGYRCISSQAGAWTCDDADPFGAGIFVMATASGRAFTIGTWAVTAP